MMQFTLSEHASQLDLPRIYRPSMVLPNSIQGEDSHDALLRYLCSHCWTRTNNLLINSQLQLPLC